MAFGDIPDEETRPRVSKQVFENYILEETGCALTEIKEKLQVYLVGKNKGGLSNASLTSRPFLSMFLFLGYRFEDNGSGGIAFISDDFLQFLDVDENNINDLFTAAIEKSRENNYEIFTHTQMVEKQLVEALSHNSMEDLAASYEMTLCDFKAFVNNITAKARVSDPTDYFIFRSEDEQLGSTGIIFNDNLKRISERINDNLFVVPASVGESYLIGESALLANANHFIKMIREVKKSTPEEASLGFDILYYKKDSYVLEPIDIYDFLYKILNPSESIFKPYELIQ